MKQCFKCGETKDLAAFYPHSRMADGHLGKCKECTKRDVRSNREANLEKYRVYDRTRDALPHRVEAHKAYWKTESGKLVACKAHRRCRLLYPEKRRARLMLKNAVRDGRIKREPCERCGAKTRVHGHHDDYSKPLSVRWLCSIHHREIHALSTP